MKHAALQADIEVVAANYLQSLDSLKNAEEDYEVLLESYKQAVALLKENHIEFPDELVIEDVVKPSCVIDGDGTGVASVGDGTKAVDEFNTTVEPGDGEVPLGGVIPGGSVGVDDPAALLDAGRIDAPDAPSSVVCGGDASNVSEVHTQT